MKVAVVTAVYNEERHVGQLLESLLRQTHQPDEIIVVDDGSVDETVFIVEAAAKNNLRVKLIKNTNQGPAVSRNIGWRAAQSDIIVFTDGDCLPNHDWLEKLLKSFDRDETVGAVGGVYRTLNRHSRLARFIGDEIDWRYRHVGKAVDAHGSYNFAVKKSILEALGGFNETYEVPSGEDWDLSYRISREYKIIFNREAIVGHTHPEDFWCYMKNQVRRGFDRVKLYNDHPEKKNGDSYTGWLAKYQVLAAGIFPVCIALSFLPGFRFIALADLAFLILSCFYSFKFMLLRDSSVAFYGVGVQFVRCFAWAWGAFQGFLKFGYKPQT